MPRRPAKELVIAISFESPAPAGFTDLAARYGRLAAQGAGQGNAANAAYQSNIAEAAMQQQTANQNRELQASTANADRTASLESAGRQRQFQLQQGEQENQQRQEQMKTQAQLQVGVQEAELSTKERIDMQRMKNTLGEIDSSSDYTPEEKTELKGQIKYKLSGYQMRDAHAKMLMQQQALQDMHEQRAHALALKNMDDQQLAKAFDSKTVVQPHPLTGQPVKGQLDKDGVWKPLFDQHFYAPAGGKAEKPYAPPTGKALLEDADAWARVQARVGPSEKLSEISTEKRGIYEAALQERHNDLLAHHAKIQAGAAKPDSQPGQPAAQGQPQAQPQPAVQRPQTQPQPISFDKPETLNPYQKARLTDLTRDRDAIGKLNLPDDKRAELLSVNKTMGEMFEKAGSFSAMTPAQLEQLAALDKIVQEALMSQGKQKVNPESAAQLKMVQDALAGRDQNRLLPPR